MSLYYGSLALRKKGLMTPNPDLLIPCLALGWQQDFSFYEPEKQKLVSCQKTLHQSHQAGVWTVALLSCSSCTNQQPRAAAKEGVPLFSL